MADEASGLAPAQAAVAPTLSVLPPVPSARPAKSKLPARRVYGSDFVVEVEVGQGPGGTPLTQAYYPHADEWFEFLGSMTIDTYMKTLDLQKLRRRERELRNLTGQIETATGGGGELTPKDQAAIDAAEAELGLLAEEIRAAMRFTHEAVASLVLRGCWTNSRGETQGHPTGEVDPDNGLPICTFDVEALSSLEMDDLGWLSDHAYGDMRGSVRTKNSSS